MQTKEYVVTISFLPVFKFLIISGVQLAVGVPNNFIPPTLAHNL